MLLKFLQGVIRKLWQDQWAPAHPASDELTPAQARFVRMAERFPPLQRHYPACMHGFIAFSGVCQEARKAADEAIQALPELLQNG